MFEHNYKSERPFGGASGYRTEGVSARLYIFQMVLFIAFGLGVSGFASMVTYSWSPSWMLILVCFVIAIVGILITFVESTPIAAIGYAILTAGL